MSQELKEYPTDQDYAMNREYWRDFIRRQKEHRADLERLAWQAAKTQDYEWLRDQLLLIGIYQMQLKEFLFSNLLPAGRMVDWGEETPAWLKTAIMDAECSEIPKWQRKEALYAIDMYREILVEISMFIPQTIERGGAI